jgi:hypothetical protein
MAGTDPLAGDYLNVNFNSKKLAIALTAREFLLPKGAK